MKPERWDLIDDLVIYLLIAAVAFGFVVGFLALFGGCCHSPPAVKPVPPVTIIRTWSACLEAPPPPVTAFAPLPHDDPRCAPPLSACFTRDQAIALSEYLSDLELWAHSAWARCRVAPIAKETPP